MKIPYFSYFKDRKIPTFSYFWLKIPTFSYFFDLSYHFPTCLDADYTLNPAPVFNSQIRYNLEAAVLRQWDFFYNVSLPHFTDPLFLDRAKRRYLNSLLLKQAPRSANFCECGINLFLLISTRKTRFASKQRGSVDLKKILNR